MKNYIIIAAYNEEKAIRKVLQDVSQYCKNIVVVDDGSTDRTFEIAKECGVEVLKHPINRGQGAALKTGIDYALKNGADAIVTFDADGQMQAKEIKQIILPVLEKTADIVTGSRFLGQTNIPFLRKIMLKLAVWFTKFTSGVNVTDAHNGFRAISALAAKQMNLQQDKMAHASEIINEISRLKLKHKEVPVTINYSDYSLKKGQKISGLFKILFDLVMGKFK